MRTLLFTVVMVCVIIIAAAINTFAQKRAERTASAKAYYGYPTFSRLKMKPKKQKATRSSRHAKPARGTRADAWEVRQKFIEL